MRKLLMLQPLRVYKRWPLPPDFVYVGQVPTLAFAQLRACLPGYETDHIDGTVEDLSLAELTRRAAAADSVLINAHSSIGSLNAEANLRHILETCPGKPVIMGGHHATSYDFEWLGRGAHFVVRNEGERTLPELLKAMAAGGPYDDIQGLSWRDGERDFHRNPARPLAENLDSLPVPDWSIYKPGLYSLPLAIKGYAATVESSRGCHFSCRFCAASEMWNHTQRFKSPARMLEELAALRSLGYSRLWFADDNFGADPERYALTYEGMLSAGMNFQFMAFIRADSVLKSPDTMRLAYRSGFRCALLGIESPSPRILTDCRKSLEFSQILEAVEILRAAGVFIAGFFLVGYLGEKQEETESTFRAARKLSDYPVISVFEPRLGTEDFAHAKAQSGDMFYYNSMHVMPSQANVLKRTQAFHRMYFLHPEQFRKMFFGTPTQRRWFRDVYWNLIKSVLSGTPPRIFHPWEMVRDLYP
jgi:tRNA A37 methylthiotransferase MiaB